MRSIQVRAGSAGATESLRSTVLVASISSEEWSPIASMAVTWVPQWSR